VTEPTADPAPYAGQLRQLTQKAAGACIEWAKREGHLGVTALDEFEPVGKGFMAGFALGVQEALGAEAETDLAVIARRCDWLQRQLDAANAGVPVLHERAEQAARETVDVRKVLGEALDAWRRDGTLTDPDITAWRTRAQLGPEPPAAYRRLTIRKASE
jgi:hypothetical protein